MELKLCISDILGFIVDKVCDRLENDGKIKKILSPKDGFQETLTHSNRRSNRKEEDKQLIDHEISKNKSLNSKNGLTMNHNDGNDSISIQSESHA